MDKKDSMLVHVPNGLEEMEGARRATGISSNDRTGGLLWTITLVTLGYLLGEKWHQVYMYSHRFIIPFVLLTLVFLIIAIYWKTGG